MDHTRALVITSIAAPNKVLKDFAGICHKNNIRFYLIGDTKSPDEFNLEGCDFYSVERQKSIAGKLAALLPYRHYARKNLGYLQALRDGADIIYETDDDNYPRDNFFHEFERKQSLDTILNGGWYNVYSYFTEELIWPRGFPLENIQASPEIVSVKASSDCPIQQGLADENPDVDAVFRLTRTLPLSFEKDRKIVLGKNTWCPFNSQNTIWYKDAFPLLYLPSYCSFRMTDIWRSFVAQRIAWENNWSILFYSPTVYQERNEHDLMRDFKDEIAGYLNNASICRELQELNLESGVENMGRNLIKCYDKLIELGHVGADEKALVSAWVDDLEMYG